MTRAPGVPLLLLAAAAVAQQGPPPLPMGAPTPGATRKDRPGAHLLEAKGAGVVTLVLTGEGAADLQLYLCDEEGQPLPELLDEAGQLNPGTRADRDLLASRGTELLAALVPAAGRYLVLVDVADAPEGRYTLSASFAPAPALARPAADPDGRPSGATRLAAGAQAVEVQDVVDPKEHDLRDWFVIQAGRAGTLRVVVKAPEGDLRLEAFAPGNVRGATHVSDDDLQGVPGHEALDVPVKEGEVVLVRVSAVFLQGERAAYRLVTAVVAQ